MYALGVCLAYLFAIIIISIDLNDSMSDIGLVVICALVSLCRCNLTDAMYVLVVAPTLSSDNDDALRNPHAARPR